MQRTEHRPEMAIARQTAMPQQSATMRPPLQARLGATARRGVMSPVPAPRTGTVVVRLAGLMIATAGTVGGASAVALAILTGTLNQLGS